MNELSKESRDVLKEIMNVVFGSIGLITIFFFVFVFFNLAQLVVSQFQIFEPNTYILKINGGSTTQLNPFDAATSIFTGLTIIFLAFTFYLQRKSLLEAQEQVRIAKDALHSQNETAKLQRFETTFFNLIRELNASIDTWEMQQYVTSDDTRIGTKWVSQIKERTYRGRACFQNFERILDDLFLRPTNRGIEIRLPTYDFCKISSQTDYDEYFRDFIENTSAYLPHYFRQVYNILKFAQRSKIENASDYTSLFRAQISNIEAKLLAFDAVSQYGNEKFSQLLNDYKFLKHCPNSKQEHILLKKIGSNLIL